MTIARAYSLGLGAGFRGRGFFLSALVTTIALVAPIGSSIARERLSIYAYNDTKNLVSLVEDAATLMERDGEKAFEQFGQANSKWFNEDYYFFVYALDGTCLFHPVTPELVGQNMMSLRDMNGKPIIEQITDVGKKPELQASGWVCYLWQNQTQLT